MHTRAILDSHGRIMVLMTHNTDLGDSFEREGDDPEYFYQMSVPGYAFGINTLLYAMTPLTRVQRVRSGCRFEFRRCAWF